MALLPVTTASESSKAIRTIKKRLTAGCEKYPRQIGWQGGTDEDTVYWNPRERFWVTGGTPTFRDRYWFPLGTMDPNSSQTLAIVVECNPPVKGVNHSCAGALLTDGKNVYLAHSGKIGGGRKGIGKTNFVRSYPHGNWQAVQWPDGRQSEMIVIGRVDGTRISAQVADFVRSVEKFKESVYANAVNPTTDLQPGFTPEFAGKRAAYRTSEDIESSCDHGLVVNELKARLEVLGVKKLGNDQARDLFILTNKGRLAVLFEVKTDVTPHSIYEGIGQLLFHSTEVTKTPRRCLVFTTVAES